MLLDVGRIDKKKVASFGFRELSGRYLLTNDIGEYCFLDQPTFQAFLSGKTRELSSHKHQELCNKGFIRDGMDFSVLSRRYARKNAFLRRGPCLHIIVVTLRCDHECLYCQTGSHTAQPGRYVH